MGRGKSINAVYICKSGINYGDTYPFTSESLFMEFVSFHHPDLLLSIAIPVAESFLIYV